jgi:SAM-dependent methyltransferase
MLSRWRPCGQDGPVDDDRLDLNRKMWDERVPIHLGSDLYDVAAFRSGERPNRLREFEPTEVGDVRGRDLVHLQCHIGTDTLSWARLGARVVGLDFSQPAIDAARLLADEIGVEAEFVCADALDAVTALGRTFDIVYTGFGAVIWIPDIRRWAQVCADLLRPGGFLYLAEFHPFIRIFAWEGDRVIENDYFDRAPAFDDTPGTYTDFDAPTENNASYEWHHTLGDVVTAIADAGLVLELLSEHDHTLYPRWPWLVDDGSGIFRTPAGIPRLPLRYSLRARKP